ncbi:MULTISPECIES: LysM peptidoglycan-binding domain-containing protein [unclassified Streptomyces]|uniref:LysM peptidoglycan-binding domain-containing protein n=1 Tax=Streptomyces sp. NBC_00180 TaxID=2903632 RepID=A0AAU1I9F9_9ACTN|nr:LysM peptidoglycan-binding domain-containing protein [Streptomyces sp. NBC_01017]WSV34848.1 LysM peptidoglycan-binding domain-containing protein [Streptomyces sp. NBC_01017]
MTAPPQYTNWAPGHDRAKLVSISPAAPGFVLFNYNPLKIQFKRTPKTSSRAMAEGASPTLLEKSPLAGISIGDIILSGQDTKARCDLLMGWCAPPTILASLKIPGFPIATELPLLSFQWGPPAAGFFYLVRLEDVTIAYDRFDKLGLPLRATVSLSMREQPNVLGTLPTNPSSGGLPGRSSHLVREGDNLTQITTEHYGHPKHWRALAKANGIDDPLRVKPGQYVYLPNMSEITDEG